jgi:cobalt-zinc-cadmium efflux system membrane fusion protein
LGLNARGIALNPDHKRGAVSTTSQNSRRLPRLIALAALVAIAAGGGAFVFSKRNDAVRVPSDVSAQERRQAGSYKPTDADWATVSVEEVKQREFRAENITEGKIAIDEDRSTPVFSPYAGRVTKLLAKPGDTVKRGQPMLVVETTDAVQGLNDFMSAIAVVNKARSQLKLAETVEKRNTDLYAGRATPLKDLQQAQADLLAAQNDMRSAETALDAARNRLKLLGRSDEQISAFQETGKITSETSLVAPLDGTVVQRKVGPGQYITSSAPDPVFVLGDLSTVWLIAYVRETDALKVEQGQDLNFTVLGYPERVFKAKIAYVAASLDPATHRLMVRASVDNADGALKPEMFANVTIFTSTDKRGVAAPREALIYNGSLISLWVVHPDKSIEKRQVKTGDISGGFIQVLEGLSPGERVITRGTLFIDRAATGS